MQNVKIVIGANFGDEGKGLATDYLSKDWADLVVRFNGGCQAGHTVCTSDGKRHAFGHIGSGFFNGIKTYLSKYFIINPTLFIKECNKLISIKSEYAPVYIDANCLVSTPFDVFINQKLENSRGENKHGSCGVGIHETILRSQTDDAYKITWKDTFDPVFLITKLKLIAYDYLLKRLTDLNLILTKEEYELIYNKKFIETFLEHIDVIQRITYQVDQNILNLVDVGNVVFEGAQGLLLDEDNKEYFPYVTHSKTGIHNVAKILEEINYSKYVPIDIYYVTRSYMTRHGRGPLPYEEEGNFYKNIINDETNKYNTWQENLRFGLLDFNSLAERIKTDQSNYIGKSILNLIVTWADTLLKKEVCPVIIDNKKVELNYFDFFDALYNKVKCTILENHSSVTPDLMLESYKKL